MHQCCVQICCCLFNLYLMLLVFQWLWTAWLVAAVFTLAGNVFPAILVWPFRSTPSPADGFEEMLLSWPSHTHSLQQRPGGLTSWGLGQLSAGLCRSSLHRGTQVTPPPRQWQSWAQEGWNTCPSSSFLPFITQPSSFWPAHSTRRLT